MTTVKMDRKGRLTIPAADREALGIKPGDTFFVERRGSFLIYAKATNPLDALAEAAEAEYRRGATKSLRDYAREHGIAVDAG